jgi:hypothetical protein
MNCLSYNEFEEAQCTGTADYPYPCCDTSCGWAYKKRMSELQRVLNDGVDWRDSMGGIKKWSVGTYLHYKQLI